ncbi:MAG TPA: porin [Vicinamibacteria bacterium]|nr:porin [Vicinamibacteria bacterium]
MTARSRRARAAVWATLLGSLAAVPAAVGEEGPPGPTPLPSPSPPAPPVGAPLAGGGAGRARLLWQGEGGSVALLNRVQFRWTREDPDDTFRLPGTTSPGSAKGSFRIRRAKTEFTGWFWRRELTYELQLSWAGPEPGTSTTSPLEDFILNWDASRDRRFQVAVGQFKVPLGRQEMTSSNRLQFLDRDLLSGEFTRGRDIGIQLWGLLAGDTVEYRAGVFNGNPASRLENDNDKYQFNARVTFQPFGEVRYSESDFDSRDRPLVAVAGQVERNSQHGTTNADDLDTRILGLDAVLKYRGLSLFAEYFARHRRPETSRAFDSDGFHAQAGYFLIRDRLEVAVRWAGYDPSDLIPGNDRSEKGAAVNYFLDRHNLKLQGDYRLLDDDGGATTTREIRVQAQVVF